MPTNTPQVLVLNQVSKSFGQGVMPVSFTALLASQRLNKVQPQHAD